MPTPILATEALREANATARTDVTEIAALEITHSLITDGPIRVTSADQDLTLTHEGPSPGPFAYTAIPIRAVLPGQTEGRVEPGSISMDNVDRIFDRWLSLIKLSQEKAVVRLRFYLYPDLSAPCAGPFSLDAPTASTNRSTVNVVLTVPQMHLKKFPAADYEPEDFPTLVQ
jgi:hypothetical protein